MKLISVNVGQPQTVTYKRETFQTSIYKAPIEGRAMMRTLNIDGDRQSDLSVHGGAPMAAYAYTVEHYRHWESELGQSDFPYGQFGENLTVEGMFEDEVFIGDTFRIGGARVEVTQPRVPCYKLNAKMDMPEFSKLFLKSGRLGFYFRVLEEGEIGAGDSIERLSTDAARMSVREVCRLLYAGREDLDGLRRAIAIPGLAPRWREVFTERLSPIVPT